jgi:hypothetical protein
MDPLPVEAEARCGDLPVTVPLADTEIAVPPTWTWPTEALAALLRGDHETWAADVLDDASYEVWCDTDPTLDECEHALFEWETATGQSLATIARLVGVLDTYHDQFEADLVRYCDGQDLRDLWRPGGGPSRLTWRRLGVIYDALPGESLTKTAQANDLGEDRLAELAKEDAEGFGPWSHTDMRLAAVEDAINRLTYWLIRINTDKAAKIREPEPVRRPGVARKRRRTITAEDLKYLQYLRDNQGAMPPGYAMTKA